MCFHLECSVMSQLIYVFIVYHLILFIAFVRFCNFGLYCNMKDFCSQNTYRDFAFLGEFVTVIHLNIPQSALSQDIVTVSLVDTDILTCCLVILRWRLHSLPADI